MRYMSRSTNILITYMPRLRAKYEVVKVLKKMHIAHPVAITSKLDVVIPLVMAVQDEEEYQEYLKIIKIVQEELRKLKRKNSNPRTHSIKTKTSQ